MQHARVRPSECDRNLAPGFRLRLRDFELTLVGISRSRFPVASNRRQCRGIGIASAPGVSGIPKQVSVAASFSFWEFNVRAKALIGPPTRQPAQVDSLRRAADHQDSFLPDKPGTSRVR
jgi:hypothetical protein